MISIEPTHDWAEDFDIFDPRYVRDPYPVWNDLRGRLSGRPHGAVGWLASANDPRRRPDGRPRCGSLLLDRASRWHRSRRRTTNTATGIRSIIATDPPDHTPERRLLLPFFAPKAVERFREPTRELCRQLLRGFVERGEVDAAEEYAKQIPPRVIAEILGIDPSRGDDFAEWVRGVLELGLTDPEVREKYRKIIEQFFLDEIERRRAEPGDDLISYLINAELDGRPVPMHVVRGNVSLMLIAGIDTTWSSIGVRAVAPGPACRRSPPARRGAGADPDRRRGVPARLLARHHGPHRTARHDDRRPRDQGGRTGAAVVPGRQSRSRRVRACRRSHHRPRGQSPRRVRRRYPPLRRLQPGAHGDAGCDRGVPGDDPRVRAGRPSRRSRGPAVKSADPATCRCGSPAPTCSHHRIADGLARPWNCEC